jgi:putative photosynthetic complex assembly protein
MKSVKPQWLVLGAMVSSIIFVIGFQVFNFEPINVSPNSTIITSKLIYIEQSDDLATKILNENGAILVEYPKGEQSFVSTVLTVINRDRLKRNLDKSDPLILQKKENGRISIFDPSSEKEIDLMAFGEDNILVFRDILGR